MTSTELARRRPVWAALSELFLDTELQEGDFSRVACVLIASGYSESELKQILRSEVCPVLLPNLLSVAGEWAGFDLAWLEAEILRRRHRWWSSWWAERVSMRLVAPEWARVRALLKENAS